MKTRRITLPFIASLVPPTRAALPDTAPAPLRFPRIPDMSDGFATRRIPALNDVGRAAFDATFAPPREPGVFVGAGGALTLIADANGAFRDFASAINASLG